MKKLAYILAVVLLVALLGCAKIGTKEEMCKGMSLTEAKQIAVASECGDRLKETVMCNEGTNTWWIDLNVQQKGCNPACVIHTDNRTAEINWRCTGLLVK